VWKEFSFCDGMGDTPIGPEYDIIPWCPKYRGIVPVGFATTMFILQSDFKVFVVSAQMKLGMFATIAIFDKQGATTASARESLHLPHAAGDRHVQIGQCLRADSVHPIPPTPALKILDRVHKRTLIHSSVGRNIRAGWEVAHQQKNRLSEGRPDRIAGCDRFFLAGSGFPSYSLRAPNKYAGLERTP